VTARINAINSLGVFSSLSQHFLIVAPSSTHKDTGLICDKATYQRRGWCRLEQWGHMMMWGMKEMYFHNAATGKNEPLGDADVQWKEDSIMVFEGDYTNPDNLYELVDVVLGLYAMVLVSDEPQARQLHGMIQAKKSRVFPEKYFEGLVERMNRLFETDPELKSHMTGTASKVALAAAERTKTKAARQADLGTSKDLPASSLSA